VSARDGADGLRDLRDPTTATALLALLGGVDDELSVLAAHALVSMNAPQAAAALDRLATARARELRRLAELWRDDTTSSSA
jgi:Mn-containing catalase